MNTFAIQGYHHYFVNHGWVASLIILTLVFLAFEIWMLVDVITRKKVPTVHRIWWIIGMFIFHPLVAFAYFIVSRWTNAYK